MNVRYGLILWAVVIESLSFHQGVSQSLEGGARAVALGYATTALDGDPWAANNPASWATLPRRSLAFFGSERFLLPELRLAAFTYSHVTSVGVFTAQARTFGFDAFRESNLDLGFGKSFRLGTHRPIHFGIRLTRYFLTITEYGTSGATGVSVGWMVRVISNIQAGFSATNINASRYPSGEQIPRSFTLGFGYVASKSLLVMIDVYKEVSFPVSIRAGTEIFPVSMLALRTGITTNPTRFCAGAGIRVGSVEADVAGEHHLVLGWSPAVALSIKL